MPEASAAAASASSSSASCSRRSGAPWRRCRCWPRSCWARCRRASSAARRSASAGCRGVAPATRSSPRRSSSCRPTIRRARTTRAGATATGWRLDGVKNCVPAAHLARRILVPARDRRRARSASSWSTRPRRACTLERQVATNRRAAGAAHARRRARRRRRRARRSGAAARTSSQWLVERGAARRCARSRSACPSARSA